jgi:hypothetical protein
MVLFAPVTSMAALRGTYSPDFCSIVDPRRTLSDDYPVIGMDVRLSVALSSSAWFVV